MNDRLYVDVHVLQTVPPSCINRDDTGSPKTAVYGGTTRARVSSQAWKRAVRMMFRDLFPAEQVGRRTKKLPDLLANEISFLAPEADSMKLALAALESAGVGVKKKENATNALFFVSNAQLRELAKLSVAGEKDKKAYKRALNEGPSIDIALFGRMVATDTNETSLNYDAVAQVAHSISTHTARTEYDYFTAVDDCAPEDNAGAGHLGTVEFNSSTLYRYATVNVAALAEMLQDDSAQAVRGFVEAFVRSMPTGKQNTFANRTVPDMVYVTLRRDQPVNLVGAFECPVPCSDMGYAQRSAECLVDYATQTYHSFVSEPELALGVGASDVLSQIADVMPLTQLLDRLEAAVTQRLSTDEVS